MAIKLAKNIRCVSLCQKAITQLNSPDLGFT
jgi:hypothetical protein